MYKASLRLICIFVVIIISSGCNKKDNIKENRFVEGQDFSYMLIEQMSYKKKIAQSDQGYYIVKEGFLYFVDQSNGCTTPVCDWCNCLHQEETDATRQRECNAYVGTGGFVETTIESLQYYDNDIYYMTSHYKENTVDKYYTLYRISKDGKRKTTMITLKDIYVHDWIIHRGKLYYIGSNYEASDESQNATVSIKVLYEVELGQAQKNAKEVLHTEDGYYGDLNNLNAYGNYVYVTEASCLVSTNTKLNQEYVTRYYYYDLLNQSVNEMERGTHFNPSGMSFINGHIIYYNYDGKNNVLKGCYCSDLDGSKETELAIGTGENVVIYTDQEYIYTDNYWDVVQKGKERTITIYDLNGKKIDWFTIKKQNQYNIVPGGINYMFLEKFEEAENDLYYIEKKQFGTLQGKEVKMIHLS